MIESMTFRSWWNEIGINRTERKFVTIVFDIKSGNCAVSIDGVYFLLSKKRHRKKKSLFISLSL